MTGRPFTRGLVYTTSCFEKRPLQAQEPSGQNARNCPASESVSMTAMIRRMSASIISQAPAEGRSESSGQ